MKKPAAKKPATKKPAPKAKDLKPKKDAKGGLSLSIKPSRLTYEYKVSPISLY